ncbi:MAG: cohesin domain-containing protein, partial [Saprospiraceae bacterium]|nr:cohesin domain-containing protein [Saprospiraceae bacterium]
MKKILSFLICGLGIQAIALAQPTVSLPTESPCTSEEFCMDVILDDFTDILSMQFSLRFDPEVIRFEQVTNFGLPQMDAGSFDLSQVDSGYVLVNWGSDDCDNADLVTREDGHRAFTLCFTALGGYGDTTRV